MAVYSSIVLLCRLWRTVVVRAGRGGAGPSAGERAAGRAGRGAGPGDVSAAGGTTGAPVGLVGAVRRARCGRRAVAG